MQHGKNNENIAWNDVPSNQSDIAGNGNTSISSLESIFPVHISCIGISRSKRNSLHTIGKPDNVWVVTWVPEKANMYWLPQMVVISCNTPWPATLDTFWDTIWYGNWLNHTEDYVQSSRGASTEFNLRKYLSWLRKASYLQTKEAVTRDFKSK